MNPSVMRHDQRVRPFVFGGVCLSHAMGTDDSRERLSWAEPPVQCCRSGGKTSGEEVSELVTMSCLVEIFFENGWWTGAAMMKPGMERKRRKDVRVDVTIFENGGVLSSQLLLLGMATEVDVVARILGESRKGLQHSMRFFEAERASR